jgi:hypothetical protein
MAAPLYPIAFVGQVPARLGQHLRVYGRENSRRVSPLQFLAGVKRIAENQNRVLLVRVNFAVRVRELVGGDKSRRERRANGLERLFG